MDENFSTPLLVCDIGGTNTRVGFIAAPGGDLKIVGRLRTGDFPTFEAALQSLEEALPEAPRSLIICGAGPVRGRQLALTNASWTLDGPSLTKLFRLEQGLLLNDFEAQALSLPVLDHRHSTPIGQHIEAGSGPQLILGPGTGLGVAALVRIDGRFAPIPSEAGHIDIGPVGETEEALWPYLDRFHGRHTAESLLSGAGLVRLYGAIQRMHGYVPAQVDPRTITARAMSDSKSPEHEAVRLFWDIAARFSGDMAITFKATGGVTLAGGILPRLATALEPTRFRALFEAKPPVTVLAAGISTRLLTEPDAVLTGMAALASAPSAYALDYKARLWV
jgi:glucokinase